MGVADEVSGYPPTKARAGWGLPTEGYGYPCEGAGVGGGGRQKDMGIPAKARAGDCRRTAYAWPGGVESALRG